MIACSSISQHLQCSKLPAVAVEENYLLLLDARNRDQFEESHCLLARSIRMEDDDCKIPFGADLTTTIHCVVYDSNTVSPVENTPAVQTANKLAQRGSRNPVKILTGGYERFSAEYPFLRTQKILYTQLELEQLPRYPSEVLPLLLYLGDCSHAYNAALIYNMKLHALVNMAGGALCPAFPGSVQELSIPVEDSPDANLLDRFTEICQFIGERHQHSERVLVYGELGVSRAAAAVVAYLMYGKKWTLENALKHVEQCRPQVSLQTSFLTQLQEWERQLAADDRR